MLVLSCSSDTALLLSGVLLCLALSFRDVCYNMERVPKIWHSSLYFLVGSEGGEKYIITVESDSQDNTSILSITVNEQSHWEIPVLHGTCREESRCGSATPGLLFTVPSCH